MSAPQRLKSINGIGIVALAIGLTLRFYPRIMKVRRKFAIDCSIKLKTFFRRAGVTLWKKQARGETVVMTNDASARG
jgi:hypothetical protein